MVGNVMDQQTSKFRYFDQTQFQKDSINALKVRFVRNRSYFTSKIESLNF